MIPLQFYQDAAKAVNLLISTRVAAEDLEKEQQEKVRGRGTTARLTEKEKKEKKQFDKNLKLTWNLERAVMRVLVRTVRNSVWPGYTGRTLCATAKGAHRPSFHNERVKIGGG